MTADEGSRPIDDLDVRLALALDVDDLVAARRLAAELRPWFDVAKVGLELFSAAGTEAIGTMIDLGYDVFCDLKLHDIPTTVEKASRVMGALGVSYLTAHAHGGVQMLRAAVDGFAEGAGNAGLADPTLLAVTVLTSDFDAPEHIVPKRVRVAVEAGCGGIVCATPELRDVRTLAPRLVRVTPGIRPVGVSKNDQAKTATPSEAVAEGANVLVIGRPVTRADDPAAAAAAIVAELAPG